MRLFEAIMEANHRAVAGDTAAGLRPADFADSLPVAALTCIDPRLNAFFPEVLGLTREHFIWLRNAGNIIFGPMSSMMRSLALACAVKGAREVAVIGHTDCQVCKTSTMKLIESFRALGVERGALPEDLTEFFGLFASEQQNVSKAAEFIRSSPLIGPRIPVHGLMVDVNTGRLDWVVNGYQTLEMNAHHPMEPQVNSAGQPDAFRAAAPFQYADMKFPDAKIGEAASNFSVPPPAMAEAPEPEAPKKLKPPPPIPPKMTFPLRMRRK